MTANEIQEKLQNAEFEISLHAFEEAVDDYLSLSDVVKALLLNGEKIEEYSGRCRCLLHCKCDKQHIHVVIDYNDFAKGTDSDIVIVTIYKPDPTQWVNYRKPGKS